MTDWLGLPPRRCLREPIPELFAAAELLDEAARRHLAGDGEGAGAALRAADMPVIAAWTESLWGRKTAAIHRYREVPGMPAEVAKEERDPVRHLPKDDPALAAAVIARDGHRCRYCGIPVVRDAVRIFLNRRYPEAARWRAGNANQHVGLQALWLQYEHVVPHSRGGRSTLANVVISCAPCNYGKTEWTLEEIALLDPREREVEPSDWDGLERLLPERRRMTGPAAR